ncbi:MAG: hypothetical protein GXO71_05410 [Caldiserica bacterium]|nr:hypothetical protein [Caldisericota bacterium]
MKRGYFFLLIGLVVGVLLVLMFSPKSEAQKSSGALIAISPGSTPADPTLFILNAETRTLCVYQLQGNILRFIAKRNITNDFLVKNFRTK